MLALHGQALTRPSLSNKIESMCRTSRALAFLVCLCFLAALPSAPAAARARAIPEPFTLFLAAPGVAVYGNEDTEGAEEYVQVLDLGAGARLQLWHGTILDAGSGRGQYGGASPRFARHYLPDVWPALERAYPGMLCLANSQFFRDTVDGMWVNPTELAFPLKSDGVVLSEGYERRRFRLQRAMLEIWDDHATISDFSRQAFYASTAPNIISGLNEQARVRATEELGRTFAGVGDRDGDGLHEHLFIYSGAAATQAHVASVLHSFGAQTIMMLDGGGSAQLACEGAGYIQRVRPLPQMMATIPAPTAERAPTTETYLAYFEETLARWLRILDLGR
jgi:hypothetical protein